jgi:hypothetical protein
MTVLGNYIQYRHILQALLIKLSKNDSIWKLYATENI